MKKTKLDILGHFLVPKVRVLSKEEKEEVLKRFLIDESLLPKIFEDDPLVVALKEKGNKIVPGDVLEFIREDPTGTYPYYRVVIPRQNKE